MGHIVVGAPGITSFALLDRLLGTLRQRRHRVSLLGFDPAAGAAWRHVGEPFAELPDPGRSVMALGLDPGPLPARLRQRLLELGMRARAWLIAERAELLLLHGDRSPEARVLAAAARQAACRVLWLGDGLLPHTLQLDECGLDGDAACRRRRPGEFRVVRGEPDLLAACLAHALARSTPVGLPARELLPLPWRTRLCEFFALCRHHGAAAGWRWLCCTRQVPAHAPMPLAPPWPVPSRPFVAVLLQDPRDPRVVFDGGDPLNTTDLVLAARAAALHLDPAATVVVVAPPRGVHAVPAIPGCSVVPAVLAPDVAATALAVVTINHPLASVALLAGTPVLHTGRALWGVRGVATATTIDGLAEALPTALRRDHPKLRQRFLSWLFGHGHVWCSGTHPSHNGMLGLVQAIETRLHHPPGALPPLRYKKGPAWPLGVPIGG